MSEAAGNQHQDKQTVCQPVEPHPLDFDWRFDATTISKLSMLLQRSGTVLALGCPSLARKLTDGGREILLVDRQPFHCSDLHVELDIQVSPPELSGFGSAVIDPPWYPEHVKRWVAWAANCVVDGAEILVSIWPSGTRPFGEREYQELKEWMQTWSEISLLEYQPTYETPPFELASETSSGDGALSTSPRVGRLIRLRLKATPSLPYFNNGGEDWTRFVFNNYQIAVRKRTGALMRASFNPVPNANGWIWPYVSRRAPLRDTIDVWSSRNEVAKVENTTLLIDALRKLSCPDAHDKFTNILSAFPSLLEWQFPRPPYWRTHEWTHRQ